MSQLQEYCSSRDFYRFQYLAGLQLQIKSFINLKEYWIICVRLILLPLHPEFSFMWIIMAAKTPKIANIRRSSANWPGKCGEHTRSPSFQEDQRYRSIAEEEGRQANGWPRVMLFGYIDYESEYC